MHSYIYLFAVKSLNYKWKQASEQYGHWNNELVLQLSPRKKRCESFIEVLVRNISTGSVYHG